ncbi:hypothetical protein [Streptomyces sp. NPDC096033]|uniref:hypothetical protein n=1 Tax=Streptomyces sp. NPDC096033 TaxID=3366071 RepID=UPI003827DC3A
MVVHTRARFGFKAGSGSSDDLRMRRVCASSTSRQSHITVPGLSARWVPGG